ncbi:histone-like nucleoid-structuring protein Lsr2 [Microbacterium kyungheense]|uniref:Lsr2 protein n=1 Tax=Microbacterium kyungheense TaxID=1263636 RepID=A0A543F184_9MICO|nr:Lsr2 family protein [Microbacterium kyungheense]TQM27569.1 Lsr2 protein [Microbacterium kyungheense]
MARKIIHQLVDDIDGTVLEVGDGETILFSLDGIAYEIDLSAENAAALRDALSAYTSAGRRVSSGRSTAPAPAAAGRRRAGQRDLGVVREWAKANGFKVSERGRVPASILDAYDAAH